ncbi:MULTISPECIES: L,D-transpeptidase [unclassified Caballeronia]|uniref:L,D-transpeptidase n=1 Tax=unclassified Caballeronia TaxID=2646786 RepID=UPI002865F405|nr:MULTISPECIES: L,D-transpeptidase [unclassified Caballeronia]MDR5753581.1 L,D-transpeptidase [Caballeronia sp. LZ024]MDR5839960.1 L,D-transpeptidase [Caballeronia sp. LZ031]
MLHAGSKDTRRGTLCLAIVAALASAVTAVPALGQDGRSAPASASTAQQPREWPPLLPTPGAPPPVNGGPVQLPRPREESRPLPAMPVPPTSPVPSVPASGAQEAPPPAGASEVEAEVAPPPPAPNVAQQSGLDPAGAFALRQVFVSEVKRRLAVPVADQQAYGRLLQQTLAAHGHGDLANEYVVLVDRSQNAQALFIYFRAKPGDAWSMIGATPVATGRPGTYDHFLTPLGVFAHTPLNMDYRAEGTENEFGIRGYGARDMRIYDFGWADSERGWGKGGISPMRFQMHATDPDKLEPVLGIRHSKGCVRIPAALNVFLDHRGILDADYEARAAEGESLWILKNKREATPWAGRYLVVVDTARKVRPAWSPAPGGAVRAKVPANADSAD